MMCLCDKELRLYLKLLEKMGIETRTASTVNQENRKKVSSFLTQNLLLKNLSRLPADLVEQILSRIPAQYLLVLKRSFDGHNYKFVCSLLRNGKIYSSLDLSFLKSTSWLWSSSLDVVGSSNGLVCLRLFYNESPSIIVWNPATKKRRHLPDPRIEPVIGFEFIEEIKDYKLVSIKPSLDVIKSQVFTGSSKSWKNVQDFPLRGVDRNTMIHSLITLDGVVYSQLWTRDGSSSVVLAFDLLNEVFDVIPLPKARGWKMTFFQWRCTLAFLAHREPNYDQENAFSELWFLNQEEGSSFTWTKEFTCESLSLPGECFGAWNGLLLLKRENQADGEDLLFYNPTNQKVRDILEYNINYKYCKAVNYAKSQASVLNNRC